MLNVALTIILLTPQGSGAPRFEIQRLPGNTDGPIASTALAINERQLVVGSVDNAQGVRQAFAWRPHRGAASLDPDRPLFGSEAAGVNDRLDIVGYAHHVPFGPFRAMLWLPDGSSVELAAPAAETFAVDINNHSQIAGSQGISTTTAVYWDAALRHHELPQLGAGIAWAINDAGTIAGASGTAPDAQFPHQACVWQVDPDTGAVTGPHFIGSFSGTDYSEATGINELGTVVGWRRNGFHDVAFYAPPTPAGALRPVLEVPVPSTPQSTATDINDHDEIVGSYRVDLVDSAYLWSPRLGFVDLNDVLPPSEAARWVLLRANAIDDAGHIVGYGLLDGYQQAFVLVPLALR